MNRPDIRPAQQFCANFGVKAIVYGKAGTNKTPSVTTAPRPLIMLTELGVKSLKTCKTDAVVCDDGKKIDDFFKWWFGSNESSKYDTLFIDSGSELTEIILADKQKRNSHGQKAYGEMAESVMENFTKLYKMPRKHVIMICKEVLMKVGSKAKMVDGKLVVEDVLESRPYFPGNVLPIKVPHQFDCIWQAQWFDNNGQRVPAVRTHSCEGVYARTRGGLEAGVAEIEPLNFTYLFNKLMQ